jgi:hypothetical protein
MKLPPPATEFSAPPSIPAKKRMMTVSRLKQLDVSENCCPRQTPIGFGSGASDCHPEQAFFAQRRI